MLNLIFTHKYNTVPNLEVIQVFILVWLHWFVFIKPILGARLKDMVIKEARDGLLNCFEADLIHHLVLQPCLLQFGLK